MKHNQKDFKMDTVFGIPTINILWTIVAGKILARLLEEMTLVANFCCRS